MFESVPLCVGVGEGGEDVVDEALEREGDSLYRGTEPVGGTAHHGDGDALLPHLALLDLLQDGPVHPGPALQPPHLPPLAHLRLEEELLEVGVRALELTVGHVDAGAVVESLLETRLGQGGGQEEPQEKEDGLTHVTTLPQLFHSSGLKIQSKTRSYALCWAMK